MKKPEEALGNIAGLRHALENSPYDAIVAVSPENVRYTADVCISTQVSIRDRLAYIVWAKGRDPIFILCRVEEGYVREESWIQDIRNYKEFVTAPTALLVDVLRELGLETGHIGLEVEYLGMTYADHLRRDLPRLRISGCEHLFNEVRRIKTPREVALLQDGFRKTEKALLATYINICEGETERSLCRRLVDNMMHSGADTPAFLHINAGPNTGFPHKPPSDYRVKKGDIVKTDCGALYSDYITNIGRTAKLGPLSDEDRSYWTRLRAIHHAMEDLLRPGNTGKELFAAATRLYAEAGLEFPYAHNGHGLGLQVHERPMISPHEDMAFAPGMVCTIETRVRWPNVKGYHMEDLYLVTEGAPLLLSDAFANEEILVL